MTNLATLLVCLLSGIIFRVAGRMPENGHVAINAFIIHLALPALILGQIHGITLTRELLSPVAMPWLLFALSTVSFLAIGRIMRMPGTTTGALILTAVLANTSFVGLPMIETFYGAAQLSTGILIDQLGTYLVLSTAGIAVASLFSARAPSARDVVTKVLTFPPFIALVVALALSRADYPAWLAGMLHRLADTLAPLALVSVGLQLRLDQFRGNRAALGFGLGFKLVLGPLLLALLYFGLLARTGDTTRVTLFEAAMGPQIGGAIVAIQYGLNPALITLMVGIGIALSFLTLPLWYLGLGIL